ncbi:hypothetical protein [Candidatus Albibeggiatoa sp. nov. NOAA]|uniref:hypothetical protein n=1 Tax=Candidatus Albibeggiatoa sp. nov. NOAA TaxID=3162724 RepID=UPI0032FF4720|nr:hypothetical protein [Thiotrichaceae bacterium]
MKTPTKKQLLNINIISALLLVPFPMFFIGSSYLFSAPGSENGIVNNLMYYSIITYPVSFLFAVLGTWRGYKSGKNQLALYLSLLPFINILVFILGLLAIIFACDGSLVCF